MATVLSQPAAAASRGKESFTPSCGWGPQSRRAALSITFDNLGEAAEVELGLWDDQPIGRHHTASFVPRLIETLGDIRATYFIEASNAEIYPDAIRAWAAAGHEVGVHAWRHEAWADCSSERRRALLAKSIAAMRTIGIEPVGFRPPGGVIPAEAWAEFEAAGLRYCSELGEPGISRINGVMSVPFVWRAVDVYMTEDVMAFMRLRNGDAEAPLDLAAWRSALDETIADALQEGGHRTVIFHPNFLGTSEAKHDVVRHLIDTARAQDIWIAPAGDVAAFAADEMSAAASNTI